MAQWERRIDDMKLKCRINGKNYDVVNGATFSEEYNETLDSGSIILTGVERLPELRPFDDVYIYDSESEFKGYTSRKSDTLEVYAGGYIINSVIDKQQLLDIYLNRTIESKDITFKYWIGNTEYNAKCDLRFVSEEEGFDIGFIVGGTVSQWQRLYQTQGNYLFYFGSYVTGAEYGFFTSFIFKCASKPIQMPTFYRHFLIDSFSEERLNPVENLFKYKISLFSEIKKMERIQLPNISITQPLDITLRKSVADYIKQYVEMYSPTIKVASSKSGDSTRKFFLYQPKYVVDDSIDEIFGDVYCPDFSLDNPSLRTLLNQLFLVKDRIPYVKDDVIYALDFTQRRGSFSLDKLNTISGSRSSENHATSLKRNYKDALSGVSTARKVEYIGFRNSDVALMTLENMRVETKFPIYKINKIYMCYYKRAQVWTGTSGGQYTGHDKVFLCKQDITKLIKMSEETATLSKDWNDFRNNPPENIDEMAEYKLCTLTYNIGDNKIEGWGTSYSYPTGWWGDNTVTKTYIENIFNVLDGIYPYGIYNVGYLSRELEAGQYITISQSGVRLNNIVTPIPTTDGAKRLKSFFFMIDYEAFYNGTTFVSKDNEDRDDIVTNDNPSASLTLLEKDGLFQKEKANRFGNMAYSYYGTYDDISELQELGSVDDSLDDDVIIYHREYQIYENYIRASYFGSKDYVLKNYFTSVYAKHRPFNLLSYNQSIIRAENRKLYLALSKDKCYYEQINSNFNVGTHIKFNKFLSYVGIFLSFCEKNPTPETIDKFSFPNKINYGYIKYNNRMFSNDVNIFTNGHSLCLNISMWDNISMGNYIQDLNPQSVSQAVEQDFTGSVQSYYPVIDNVKTGFTQKMGVYFAHTPEETFNDIVRDYTLDLAGYLYDKLNKLPLLPVTSQLSNIVGDEYTINKDNKEVIDMTFQIEPYSYDKDVVISDWFMKLCDLYGVYSKFSKTETVTDIQGYFASIPVYCGTCYYSLGGSVRYRPMMCIKISTVTFNNLTNGSPVNFTYSWEVSRYDITSVLPWNWVVVGLQVNFTKLIEKTDDTMTFEANGVKTIQKGWWGGQEQQGFTATYTLSKKSRLGSIDFTSDTTHYYFSNIAQSSEIFFDMCFEQGFYGDSNSNFTMDTDEWTATNHSETELLIGNASGVQKTYYKNMFVRLNSSKIINNLVYDEYNYGDISFETRPVEDYITIESEENTNIMQEAEKTYLKVDLQYVPNTTKSLEFWYNDRENLSTEASGTLHFVFGVNLTEEDFTRGYIKIYASLITKKDTRVFDLNNQVIGEVTNYGSSSVGEKYGEKQYYVLKYN